MGIEAPVHRCHVEFVFKVGRRTEASQDHLGIGLRHVVDQEPLETIYADSGCVFEDLSPSRVVPRW